MRQTSKDFEEGQEDSEIIEKAFKLLAESSVDQDSESAHNNRLIMLPWWGLDMQNSRQGIEQIVKQEVLKLSQDVQKLSSQQIEFEYDFDFDRYLYVAQIMLRIDPTLNMVMNDLVPDLVEEDDFWRNYFYNIEIIKAQLGLVNRLGDPIKNEEIYVSQTQLLEKGVVKQDTELKEIHTMKIVENQNLSGEKQQRNLVSATSNVNKSIESNPPQLQAQFEAKVQQLKQDEAFNIDDFEKEIDDALQDSDEEQDLKNQKIQNQQDDVIIDEDELNIDL
ncbi:UNKNOWN [Stylonychia lemnae]|uniref:BSD domain-containing protein n=1 Tax=Stylonychia lemnae TaxID=5949 RepID=A0A078AW63_STYLE|nr:UNKNOWN [Stylonychia lemnae]|eukprot:CDW86379.1 UNKNOWN [Stylonychia lemnae]